MWVEVMAVAPEKLDFGGGSPTLDLPLTIVHTLEAERI
jgi:hypothetical protein